LNPTISRPIRTKPVTTTDLKPWAATELIPLLQEVKGVLDQVYVTALSLPTSATGTFTTVWSSPDLAVGFDWFIEATIMAHTTGARSTWIIQGLFYNNGTVTQEGVTFAAYTQSAAAFNVRFLVVSNHIDVQVQDDGALSPDWRVWIELRENP
jgi:hypothetical protein